MKEKNIFKSDKKISKKKKIKSNCLTFIKGLIKRRNSLPESKSSIKKEDFLMEENNKIQKKKNKSIIKIFEAIFSEHLDNLEGVSQYSDKFNILNNEQDLDFSQLEINEKNNKTVKKKVLYEIVNLLEEKFMEDLINNETKTSLEKEFTQYLNENNLKNNKKADFCLDIVIMNDFEKINAMNDNFPLLKLRKILLYSLKLKKNINIYFNYIVFI